MNNSNPSSAEALLAQRMAERSNMDRMLSQGSMGGGPPPAMSPNSPPTLQMPMPQPMQPQAPLAQPQIEPAHPEVIKKFMTFTEKEKKRFAAAQPQLYAKIMQTMALFPVQTVQAVQPVQPISPPPLPQPVMTFPVLPPQPITSAPAITPQPEPKPIIIHTPAPVIAPPAPTPAPEKRVMVSVDFRTDIKDVHHNKYAIRLPEKHTVNHVQIESCILPQTAQLESEPYIYIAISELGGDFISSGEPIFGKLIQEKTVNNFVIYHPENCKKALTVPKGVETLHVCFLTYDKQPIQLNRLSVSRIVSTKKGTLFKITCREPHYLNNNDKVTINTKITNKLLSEISTVRHIISPDTFVIDKPFGLSGSIHTTLHDTTIEKTNMKSTLTFKLTVLC